MGSAPSPVECLNVDVMAPGTTHHPPHPPPNGFTDYFEAYARGLGGGGGGHGSKKTCGSTQNGPLAVGALFEMALFRRGRLFGVWAGEGVGLGGGAGWITPSKGCIGRGGKVPPRQGALPLLSQVPLTASASLNGIRNRQQPTVTASNRFGNLLQPPA